MSLPTVLDLTALRSLYAQRRITLHDLVDALSARMDDADPAVRSEEHTSELQSLMRISYAVFCLKKKNKFRYPESPLRDRHRQAIYMRTRPTYQNHSHS